MFNHVYELNAMYDTRQSFYGKAQVLVSEDREILRSYSTNVAEIGPEGVKVFGTYSPTTLRHIKEFLKQHGLKADNKAQIIKDYCNA